MGFESDFKRKCAVKNGAFRGPEDRHVKSLFQQQEILMEVKMMSKCWSAPWAGTFTAQPWEKSGTVSWHLCADKELSAPVSTALWRAASSVQKVHPYLIYFSRCNKLLRSTKPAELIHTSEWKDSILLWNHSAHRYSFTVEKMGNSFAWCVKPILRCRAVGIFNRSRKDYCSCIIWAENQQIHGLITPLHTAEPPAAPPSRPWRPSSAIWMWYKLQWMMSPFQGGFRGLCGSPQAMAVWLTV